MFSNIHCYNSSSYNKPKIGITNVYNIINMVEIYFQKKYKLFINQFIQYGIQIIYINYGFKLRCKYFYKFFNKMIPKIL